MRKDIAGQLFHVVAFNASGRVSGDAANITCTISIDGGTRVTTSDVNPTEIGTTGVYVFTLSQAETDGHELSFIPSSSTSGVQVLGMPSNVIYTSTVDLTANAISAVSSAASTETASSISSIAAARVVIPTNALSIPPVRAEVSRLRVLRRSSFTHTLENVGDLAGVSKIVFTIKDNKEIDNDAASLAQVVLSIPAASSTDGIKYLGGSAAGAKRTSGSIAVQSYTEGSESRKRIVVAIADDATASIPVESNGTFDIKLIMASDSEIVDSGKAVVEEVTTWETSS